MPDFHDIVNGQIPDLNANAEESRRLGQVIGGFYKGLKDCGVPDTDAGCITIEWLNLGKPEDESD